MSNILLTPAMRSLLESDLQHDSGAMYGLSMFWLGRFDKFSAPRAELYDWITRSFVASDLLAGYAGGGPGKVLFAGQDHRHLAHFAIKDAQEYLLKNPV